MHGRGEKGAYELVLVFYRAREGEGVATGANWPLMAMAADPALMAFKEAHEGEGEVTEGEVTGRRPGCSSAP
jgi:hypothetical protein